MNNIISSLGNNTMLHNNIAIKLLLSISIAFIMIILKKGIQLLLHKSKKEIQYKYKRKKYIDYIVTTFIIIIITIIWFEETTSITTFLGLVSAGLAISLKDLIVGIAGWIFILWRKPFSVGDRIEINNKAGDVIDIRLFQFTILEIGNWVHGDQSTGRIIHIPNNEVFIYSVANYSKGFQYIWNEIHVMVTFESNWQSAKSILLNIAKKHTEHLTEVADKKVKNAAKKYMIYYSRLTPTVYTKAVDSGVLLSVRYLCEPRKRRESEELIWEDILISFKNTKDIDLAYRTSRIFNNTTEGKT